ncbi:reverse transcriptase domain-containing protein [Tanacetum coccineum]
MDDEPMWAADRVVALTPGSAITIPETANEFDIKANHLTLFKGNEFDKIRAFSQNENESLTDAWLRIKELLRNCHGHNLSKGNVIKIFYHGLSEITQEILNATAGGRPFLHTANAVIRVKQKQLNLGVGTERMIFNIDSAMKHSYSNDDTCFSIDVIDEILEEDFDALLDEGSKILHSIEGTLLEEEIFSEFNEFIAMTEGENSESESDTEEPPFEKITINTYYKIKTSLEEPPTDLELKPLPNNLEYVFLEEPSFLPVIISSQLSAQNKGKLVSVLKKHKEAFAWKTTDIPGICPSFCKHKIQLLDDKKPVVQKQRRRMPFGLCNAPATFQRCMLAIFHDMIEESIEVFMDDFSVFGNSFDKCLNNLDKMLQRCKDAHLVLNWEKCHFMVKEGIVLGHKVSIAGLEVDKAKINVISKLSPPTNIKGVRSFLGHAGFYRCFIEDFSKIAQPKTKLLEKDTPFEFNDECQKAFEILKEKLACAPVIDIKGIENVAADHLSRIENDESSDDSEVDDYFPGETLMEINTKDEPWFADFANYLFEYILIAVDYVSKWAGAQALPTNDARVVIDNEETILPFQNAQSSNQRPRYSLLGQVENINRALKRILKKTIKDNPAIWSRKLDDALWAFRTAYKTPTGTTPYKLIYDKNCHFPFEIEHRAYWALKNCNPDLIAAGEKRMF